MSTESPLVNLIVDGIPDSVMPDTAAVCRSRLIRAISELSKEAELSEISVWIGNKKKEKDAGAGEYHNDDIPVETRAKQYTASDPYWKFEQLVATAELIEDLYNSVELIRLEVKVFDEWGLRAFEPFPRSILNFHGPPGTGKTLAAHALSSFLEKRILIASYAQIESKFHGDGPKNVEALFFAAKRDDAILFIDEADSLLSKRLTNVTQGSEQAINSMRSQLLICLEKYNGIVIFASNLVKNYDSAFDTRVKHIHFQLPNEKLRSQLWVKHLPKSLPQASDININELVITSKGLCGRDIKNIVIQAALSAARLDKDNVTQSDILSAVTKIHTSRSLLTDDNANVALNDMEKEELKNELKCAFEVSKNIDL